MFSTCDCHISDSVFPRLEWRKMLFWDRGADMRGRAYATKLTQSKGIWGHAQGNFEI